LDRANNTNSTVRANSSRQCENGPLAYKYKPSKVVLGERRKGLFFRILWDFAAHNKKFVWWSMQSFTL